MNLELLDPFRNSFPEVIEETLEEGFAICCAFNRRGTLIATGCHDGRCVIWDFDTRGIATILSGHNRTITSVSWSRNGRKLLSSSIDCTINLYEVMTGATIQTVKFNSVVMSAQMSPQDDNLCIVCPLEEQPVFINLTTGERKTLPEVEDKEQPISKKTSSGRDKNAAGTVAVFNKNGDKIFTGNSRGVIVVIDVKTLEILYSFKVPGGSSIKAIQFSRSGKEFLINSMDRIVRVFEGEESKTVAREFQDPVNRTQWKKCCFSSDGDYIIGGAATKSRHYIYLWNRDEGQLIKTLEGPKEEIVDLVWHPTRSIIASISTSGVVYIWASNYTENWSAFAPDFKELEENEEYIEKESEFDLMEEVTKRRKYSENNEDVDVTTVDPIAQLSSDEEDELLFIPLTIPADPEIQHEETQQDTIMETQQDTIMETQQDTKHDPTIEIPQPDVADSIKIPNADPATASIETPVVSTSSITLD